MINWLAVEFFKEITLMDVTTLKEIAGSFFDLEEGENGIFPSHRR